MNHLQLLQQLLNETNIHYSVRKDAKRYKLTYNKGMLVRTRLIVPFIVEVAVSDYDNNGYYIDFYFDENGKLTELTI